MVNTERVFLETVGREFLLPRGSRVTVAVSGGSDSVAMLHLIDMFAPSRNWKVSVLHINHGLRGEADSDEAFVRSICRKLSLDLHVEYPEAGSGGSMESRWSSIRSEIYLEQEGIVTVGHTATDRAETVLMRLFEGAGLRGLGGMDYRGVGSVQRPMLDMRRADIQSWLFSKGFDWVEDTSNSDLTLRRNRVRLEVLPVIEKSFPEAVHGIARSGAVLSRWRDLQEQLSFLAIDGTISRSELLDMPEVLGALVLWQMAGKPRKGFHEFTKTLRWLRAGRNGYHVVPGGKRLVANVDRIHVEDRGSRRY